MSTLQEERQALDKETANVHQTGICRWQNIFFMKSERNVFS